MANLFNLNKDHIKRRLLTIKGKKIDLMCHLRCVFNQGRFLINGIEMSLQMIRSRDTFCLMDQTEQNFEIHILDATLLVRYSKISLGVLLVHAKTTAKYPLTRVEMKSIFIHSGTYGETLDNVILSPNTKTFNNRFCQY